MTAHRQTESTRACRQNNQTIRKLYQQVDRLPYVRDMCDALPHVVLILNGDRQIIYANRKLLDLTGLLAMDNCLGTRPGELLHCINAETAPAGCGTSENCRVCGAMTAILDSRQENKSVTREFRLTARQNGDAVAYDFKVSASPFLYDRTALTMLHLIDISDEKRRRVLERIFFHDILNTAGSLLNLSQLMSKGTDRSQDQRATLMLLAAKQLIDEIKAQRELMEAENGELDVYTGDVHSLECLKRAVDLFEEYREIHRIDLRLSPESSGVFHQTDPTLLLRVLGNLIKNALEACRPGQTVTVGCHFNASKVEYWVRNPGHMPREVQLQIFQRSFSTKGAGRGLGTYSIRLLTEKFLNGNVAFESSEEAGTRFMVQYPLAPN